MDFLPAELRVKGFPLAVRKILWCLEFWNLVFVILALVAGIVFIVA
jgi:hypothetical protein